MDYLDHLNLDEENLYVLNTHGRVLGLVERDSNARSRRKFRYDF